MPGLEAEGQKQNSTRFCRENGLACRGVLEFGDEFQASTLRTAAYVQDEWNPSKQWSAYAGLRWEGIDTRTLGSGFAPRVPLVRQLLDPTIQILRPVPVVMTGSPYFTRLKNQDATS